MSARQSTLRPLTVSEFFAHPDYESASTEERLEALDDWAAHATEYVRLSDPNFKPSDRADQTAWIREMRTAILEGKKIGEMASDTMRDVGVSLAASGLSAVAAATGVVNAAAGQVGDINDVAGLLGNGIVRILDRLGERRETTDPDEVDRLAAEGFTARQKAIVTGPGGAPTMVRAVDRREKLDQALVSLKAGIDNGDFPEEPEAFVDWLRERNTAILQEAARYNDEPTPEAYTDQETRRFDGDLELQGLLSTYARTRNDAAFAEITRRLTATTSREEADADTARIVDESAGVIGEMRDRGATLDGPLAGPLRSLLQAPGVSDAAIEATGDPVEMASTVVSAILTGGTAKAVAAAAGAGRVGRAATVAANTAADVAIEAGTEAFQAYVEDSRGDIVGAAKQGGLVGLAFQLTGAALGGVKRAGAAAGRKAITAALGDTPAKYVVDDRIFVPDGDGWREILPKGREAEGSIPYDAAADPVGLQVMTRLEAARVKRAEAMASAATAPLPPAENGPTASGDATIAGNAGSEAPGDGSPLRARPQDWRVERPGIDARGSARIGAETIGEVYRGLSAQNDATPDARRQETVAPSEIAADPEEIPPTGFDTPATDAATPVSQVASAPIARPTRLQVDPTPGTEPISAPKVIEAISSTMKAVGSNAPTRVGNLTTRRSRGEFDMKAEVSRIRTANNIPTAAHEAAHGIEKAVFGFPHQWQKVVSPVAFRELTKLGKALYGNIRPVAGYDSEGFAEYLRIRITQGRDVALREAPKFTEYFETKLLAGHPKLGPAVEKATDYARRWEEQGSINRAKQGIETPESIWEMVSRAPEAADLVTRQLVEMALPVRDLVVTAARKRGAPIQPGEDPYLTLKARRMTHDAIAEYWAEKGMTDFAGNVVGKSLREALAPVKGRMEDFIIYLWARRAQAMMQDGKSRNPGLSPEDTQKVIDELDSPEFQLAAQGLYDWNDGMLNYVAEASPDFARVVSKIRMGDPGAYIPLQREFDAIDKRSALPGQKGVSPFRRLRGSGRRIKNPIQSILAQASGMIAKAHEKKVLDQMIRLATSVEGLGHLIIEVPKTQVPVAARTLEELVDEIRRRLEAQGGGIDVDPGNADLTTEALTFFAPAYQPRANEDPILPVYRRGKVRWYQLDRELYRSLSSMDVYRLPKALDLFLGVPARMFRLGTTGLRASFSLVTNPLRDFRVMLLNSRSSANAAEMFFTWIKSLGEAALDTATAGRVTTEWIQAFERLGGQMAQQLRQDTRHTKRAARRLFQGRLVRTVDPRNAFDLLREILQVPESATRIAELKTVAKDVGWVPGQPMTEDQAAQLLLAAKEVSTDFSAAGELSRVINQSVPFFNASIQGPRAHIRALRLNPQKFFLRGLLGTALALGLWARNHEEDWWEELPAKERYLFTWIPFTTPDGKEELLRIPRAFEADGIFMAMAEVFADAWYRRDPKLVGEWFETFVSTGLPGSDVPGSPIPIPMPVLAEEALEQAANRDFFFGNPIVPAGEERLPAPEQHSPHTTRVSIALGEMFDISPRRIDHAIRGVFGGTGIDFVALLGRGKTDPAVERESELADLPVIGVLFQYGGQSSLVSKSVDELYDRLEFAEKSAHSKRQEETDEQRDQRLQLADAARAVTVLGLAARATPEVEKRRELLDLRLEIAQAAVDAHDNNDVRRREFQRWRKKAERLAE